MKRIGNSKEPTIRRMQNVVSNLRDKRREYVSLELQVSSYIDSTKVQFWFYIESGVSLYLDTWPEVLEQYRKLMR